MPANSKVIDWLESHGASFEVIEHDKVMDAAEEARILGVGPEQIGKALVLHVTHTSSRAVVLIPGNSRISMEKIRELFGVGHARLALEDELSEEFPQFELGAVPPLGELLMMPVYIDRRLVNQDTVLFNAGSHTASIKMSVHDLINIGDLAVVDVADEERAA